MANTPFLTIVTRCYKRPMLLRTNVQSLKAQTDPDYEQIFIVDKQGRGFVVADQSLDKFKHYNTGKYVMVLDDDDLIVSIKFIETIKAKCQTCETYPDIIIWRGQFVEPPKIMPTLNDNWGKRVVKAKIGSFNYAVKNSLYSKYIKLCNSGVTGDFDFIKFLTTALTPPPFILWMEDVFVGCQIKGQGKPVTSVEQRV